MKKTLFIMITILLITSLAFSAKLNVGKDKIVKVNNRIITLDELEKNYNDLLEYLPEGQTATKKQVLDQMINAELILEEAKKTKSIVPDENKFKQYLEYSKQTYTAQMKKKDKKFVYSDEKFKKYLEKEEGTTYEKFEEKLKDKLLAEEFTNKKAEPLANKLRNKNYTSKSDFPVKMANYKGELKSYNSLKEFYDDNKSQFFLDGPVYVKHIFMATVAPVNNKLQNFPPEVKAKKKKMMEDIYKRLLKGENFDSLCELFSEDLDSSNFKDPSTGKYDRGYIGPVVKSGELATMQKKQFGEDLVKKILQLPVKKYSPVLEGVYGYHIFYVIKKEKSDILAYDYVKEQIIGIFRNAEYQSMMNEEYTKMLSDLKKKASITYYNDEYK